MKKDTKFLIHNTPELFMFSFRKEYDPIDKRSGIFLAHMYGEQDAVMTVFGIQGNGYFKAVEDNIDEIMKNTYAIQGYVFEAHLERYKAIPKIKVDVLWYAFPYGEDKKFAWILVRKIDSDGNVIGPVSEIEGLK